MAKTRILSTAEIKKIIGSNQSTDTIDYYNDTATEMLCDLLNVEDISVHSVVDERVRSFDNGLVLPVKDFPVSLTGITIKDKDNVAIQTAPAAYKLDPKYIRHLRAQDASGYQYTFPVETDLLVSYSAGYILQDILVLTVNPTAGQTITARVALVSTTYTFTAGGSGTNEIKIESTLAATVTNLLAKVSGVSVEAPTGTFTITFPVGSQITASQVGALTKGNIPYELKTACAYLVAACMAQLDKVGSVQSYTIGQKSINFSDANEARFVQDTVKKYSFYNSVSIFA